jgi:predicted ferric reductase
LTEPGALRVPRRASLFDPGSARSTYQSWISYLAWTVLAINAVVIVWLWLYDGGVSTVHGYGDLWTSIGRVTGLLSAYLALIQVLLLSRLPWLERNIGFDRLTVWHRLNGKVCLILVLAHVVFITIGYAAIDLDKPSVWTEVSRILTNYPSMVTATVGTVLMIAVVVTSLVIVRRRLRYESWYFVHLTVYAGLALAWFHQIPSGNDLTTNVAASTYWNALYVVTLALLIIFRLAVPAFHAFWYGLKVSDLVDEGAGVVSIHLAGRHLDHLHARAGQFFLWRFLTRGRWWSSHPFSLSQAPDGRSLRITVKNVGDFTREIGGVARGTRVIAEGPFGVFTAAVRRRERVLMIAGGIGITPIRAMFEEMTGDIVCIYRVIRESDLVLRGEIDRIARDRGLTVHYVVGDHTAPGGARLLSTEHLLEMVPDLVDREIFLCGPPVMMHFATKHLLAAGVPFKYIHTELFAL